LKTIEEFINIKSYVILFLNDNKVFNLKLDLKNDILILILILNFILI